VVLRFNDIPVPEVLKFSLAIFYIKKKSDAILIIPPKKFFLLMGNTNEILLEIPVDDK